LCVGVTRRSHYLRLQHLPTKMKPYVYAPLPSEQSIRLLDSWQSTEDTVRYSLRTVSLDDELEYTALSYTWGEPRLTHSIECDGAEIKITANLHSALQRVRQWGQGPAKTLWVDAICVDQENLEERGHQVRSMRRTFSAAAMTVVYLGEPRELGSCKLAVEFIQKVQREFVDIGGFRQVQRILESRSAREWAREILESGGALEWAAVCELFSQPWFRRVWVMQEYAMSRALLFQYGDESFHSDALSETANVIIEVHTNEDSTMLENIPLFLSEIFMIGGIFRMYLLELMRQWIADRTEFSMSHVLTRSGLKEATDPRDQIFGLLGLLDQKELQPNYFLTVSETYVAASRVILETKGPIELFRNIGEPRTIEGLPSWVPDWSSKRSILGTGLGLKKWEVHDAGGTLSPEWKLSKHSDILSMRGIIFDNVRDTTDAIQDSEMSNDIYRKHFLEAKEMTRNSIKAPAEEKVLVLHYKTLLLGSPISWNRAHELDISLLFTDNEGLGSEEALDAKRCIMNNMRDLQYCLTQALRVGQVPPGTQKGDQICVFQGIKNPYVIRKSADGENYMLLDRCYIDGVMNGEALEGVELEDIRLA
jgi:Heterokaryon incompatibility protein (HET)